MLEDRYADTAEFPEYVGRHRLDPVARRAYVKWIACGVLVAFALISTGGVVWSSYEMGGMPEPASDFRWPEPPAPTGS